MSWREWLGLTVSPDRFAVLVRRSAKSRGLGELNYDANMNELRQVGDGTGLQIYLGRIFEEYKLSPRKDRQALIERFLDGASASGQEEIPKSWEEAKQHVLPIVRDIIDIAVAELSVQRHRKAEDVEVKSSAMASMPLVGTLLQGVAFDTPNSVLRITDTQLQEWGVSLDTALAQAKDNLRLLNHPNGWTPLDEHTWSGNWGDAYASSRLLTPEVIHQLGVDDPIVMIPTPDTLLVASARCEDALEKLSHWSEQSGGPHKRTLSNAPWQLVEQTWIEIPETKQDSVTMRNFRRRGTASAYADQKQLLEDLHTRTDKDIWVATYDLLRRSGSEALTSYAVWTETVDSMLPLADLLVLQTMGENDEVARRLIVSMPLALPIISSNLKECDGLAPIRYRTVRFPSDEDWANLSNIAIEL